MYHEIQAGDKTYSKKSVSSTIKSRTRVKSMSNLHPLFTPNPLFIANKKWVKRINWSCLDILFTLDLLFIALELPVEADFLLRVSSSAWISWYNSVNFLQHFTTFYNILQHFTTFYYILLHFTTFYCILLHFSGSLLQNACRRRWKSSQTQSRTPW